MKKLILTLLLASFCTLGASHSVFGEDDSASPEKEQCGEDETESQTSENQG
ncbi:hypothetical protein BOKEGFJH_00916 [Chlamydia avium]|uniref:Secreted protein n=1 Tax=Chlamydia avium TaxID=1457141 RepID=A0ABN0MTD1_9CHLA|nr:hypothetical protein [Chlamydia avium]EPP36546.1 hypothetical protein CP10743SC13_0287 [Chlamydia psittaci 10_743_SC13]EPP38823.1 hypothetical protein CP10881SC42_0375 [Chlamydia avium]VVT43370.1 hypothetical protein BOKEGFJH_00916 [Chlamydia avium]